MTGPLTELGIDHVAVAWVKALGLPTGDAAATTVPEAKTWPLVGTTRAFVQVVATGGGTVGDTPYHRDIVSVDTWATKDNSDRPPLGLAYQLGLRVWGLCYNGAGAGLIVVGPDQVARIDGVHPISAHPRRIPDPDTSRAHYSLDIEISWTVEG